ncbi:hypothetical protein AVEN_5007-1, partial [Araneus ventricosus]
VEEIQKIQSLAAENGLDVIPLVQSFGHLEFLLKHDKYYEIREAERYPNALCPSHPSKFLFLSLNINMYDLID